MSNIEIYDHDNAVYALEQKAVKMARALHSIHHVLSHLELDMKEIEDNLTTIRLYYAERVRAAAERVRAAAKDMENDQ